MSPAYRGPHTRWQHRDALNGGVIRLALLVVLATIPAACGGRPPATSSSTPIVPPTSSSPPVVQEDVPGSPPTELPRSGRPGAPGQLGTASSSTAAPPVEFLPRERRGALGEADGVVPAGVTVFDGGYPAVAKLDPALLDALRLAATNAAHDGVALFVDSGWRSSRYQEELFRQAVATYGSRAEAARWVSEPGTSAHETGDAVDIAPVAAVAWLSNRGATYGLCQIYRNEPWHYERRPDAIDHGCPAMYADATRGPRMRQ